MEVVLLWLDELDDLVFAGLSRWRLLASASLLMALATAAGLTLIV
jgi:hypothetical protein